MTRYNLYDNGQHHAGVRLLAIEAGSELDSTVKAQPEMRFAGTVDAGQPATEFSPASSVFQTNQTQQYIPTGLPWPMDRAVAVH